MSPAELSSFLADLPRQRLLDGPTPIQRLSRLEEHLGLCGSHVRLFVKRDDASGLGGGGNKLRKLEFLLGDALAQGCDTFITVGGLQSNHARLSAAAAARVGISCELYLARLVPREDDDYERNGNVLLDDLLGAKVHVVPAGENALLHAERRQEELRSIGRRAYVVGTGGSSPLGNLGYSVCAAEIVAEAQANNMTFDAVLVPNGSAGTHAGLVAGFTAMGFPPRCVRAYAVLADEATTRSKTLDLTNRTMQLLGSRVAIEGDDIDVSGACRGSGYGIPTEAMIEAVRLLARTEGLLLDPVYSGKAFAGLLGDLRAGAFASGGNVLFVMTGGVPGLYAYRSAFRPSTSAQWF